MPAKYVLFMQSRLRKSFVHVGHLLGATLLLIYGRHPQNADHADSAEFDELVKFHHNCAIPWFYPQYETNAFLSTY